MASSIPTHPIVALVWIALDAQARALEHLDVAGPWRVILVLHGTKDAVIGDVAAGWPEPHNFLIHNPPRCIDANVVIRRELDAFPTAADELCDLAFDLAGRIEDGWGMGVCVSFCSFANAARVS